MRPINYEIKAEVVRLFRKGLNGPQIGLRMGFDRSKVNYILRSEVGSRRPKLHLFERKCIRCGKIDMLPMWNVKHSRHCVKCRLYAAAAANKANHTYKWTKSNCRECGVIFPIRTSDLERRWKAHSLCFPNSRHNNFTPFCSRPCYTAWQTNRDKNHKHSRPFPGATP